MSVINNALSELAKKKSATSIEAAVVPKVKTRSPLVWVTAGFTLSLAMGGWAISQGPVIEQPIVEQSISTRDLQVQVSVVDDSNGIQEAVQPISSPTTKLVTLDTASFSTENTAMVKSVQAKPVVSDQVAASIPQPIKQQASTKALSAPQTTKTEIPQPIYVASVAKTDSPSISNDLGASGSSENSGMLIEQVELTPEQLSVNAQGRAQKALDANDLTGALKGYH